MLKALFRKQFRELNSFYFFDRKSGKARTKGGMIRIIVLYVVLFGFLAFTFFQMSSGLAAVLVPGGLPWLYFVLMGFMSIMLGVFGSVFNTYAGLYHAKDNELLLSMPIEPWKILFVRMTGVYAMGMLYESLIYLPALVSYFVVGAATETPISVLSAVNAVLLWPILGLFVLALTCLLGWVVALIAGKLRNKSFLTVLITLVLLAGYYVICFGYSEAIEKIIDELMTNSEAFGEKIKGAIAPAYVFGRAAEGDPLSMVLFTFVVLVVLAAVVLVMARTFAGITTERTAERKKTGSTSLSQKVRGVDGALFIREWKHFSSSATYMLNCGLGVIFTVAAGVMLIVMSGRAREAMQIIPEDFAELLPMLLTAAVFLFAAMNDLTAPSVSLEGKSIWTVQMLPIETKRILGAKQRLHLAVSLPSVLFLTAAAAIVFDLGFLNGLLMAAAGVLFVCLESALGLILNLKNPNLTWTNEIYPIKQSMSVFVCMFGGWGCAAIVGFGGYFGTLYLPSEVCLAILSVLLAAAVIFMNRWLDTKGAEIFENL